ncbi:MAG: carboxypeptidase-like regulatory domain-containing protein [Acidobacteriia bacterium]|nr:carboxypeptidase-like regulatory domain-containing protein [Terriglobia bacterium]
MKASAKLALVTVVVMAMAAGMLYAQGSKGKDSELRTVRGTVIDKDEAPVDSAVVYLKNLHTQDIVTHLSAGDGQFRFSGLDLNVDYEIHAEKEAWASSSRSISNFDTRKEFVLTLKLDRKKGGK